MNILCKWFLLEDFPYSPLSDLNKHFFSYCVRITQLGFWWGWRKPEATCERETPRKFYYVQQSQFLKTLKIDVSAGPIRKVSTSVMTYLRRKKGMQFLSSSPWRSGWGVAGALPSGTQLSCAARGYPGAASGHKASAGSS